MRKANLSLVKNINYSLVWDYMLACNDTTIIAITKNLKLSFPTVSRAMEFGLECNLILEGAQENSAVGRKATKYKINADFNHILIVIVDSGILRGSVLDMYGNVINSCQNKFAYATFDVELIDFVSEIKQKDKAIDYVGIALDCVVSQGVIIDWIRNPKFIGVDIQTKLKDTLGLNIFIDNNMKALALGATCGNYDKNLTIATLQNGYSGFGASIAVGGEVFRGASNFAGEIGYLPTTLNGGVDIKKFTAFAQTLITIVNPHKIIVYDKFDDIDISILVNQLLKVLPSYAMPEMLKSNNFFADCVKGMYQQVKRQIFKDILK